MNVDLDTFQRGTEGPFEYWESDHASLVHVLWDARRRGAQSGERRGRDRWNDPEIPLAGCLEVVCRHSSKPLREKTMIEVKSPTGTPVGCQVPPL